MLKDMLQCFPSCQFWTWIQWWLWSPHIPCVNSKQLVPAPQLIKTQFQQTMHVSCTMQPSQSVALLSRFVYRWPWYTLSLHSKKIKKNIIALEHEWTWMIWFFFYKKCMEQKWWCSCLPFYSLELLMAEILHQLRLVAYPIIFRVG